MSTRTKRSTACATRICRALAKLPGTCPPVPLRTRQRCLGQSWIHLCLADCGRSESATEVPMRVGSSLKTTKEHGTHHRQRHSEGLGLSAEVHKAL